MAMPGGGLGADRGRRAGRGCGPAAGGGSAGCCCAADRGRAAGRCGARSCGARSGGSCTGRARAGAGGARTGSCARAGRAAAAAAAPRQPPPPPPNRPLSLASRAPLRTSSGPAGKIAASALVSERSWVRNSRQASQALMWRRAGPSTLARPSAASASSSRTSSQVSWRAWLDSASAIRARTSRLFTPGTVGVHRLGDLLVAHRVDLAEQQRGALGLGQLADVGEQVAELLAVLDALEGGHPVHVGVGVHRVLAVRGRLAKVVEAAVPGDPVEPGAHGDRALVGDHRVVGGDEDLLEHVLGVLGGAEHLAAEAEEARLVALDQRVEGVLVAPAGQGDELLVVLEAEEGRAPGEKPASLCVCEC